jgi:valyl-tRNA synthetase
MTSYYPVANREKIVELSGAQTLLKSMSSIIELPAKLEALYKKQKYRDAVECYCKTAPLLENYSSRPWFVNIARETKKVIEKIAVKIRKDIDDPGLSIDGVGRSIGLLIELKDQTMIQLSRLYIKRYV